VTKPVVDIITCPQWKARRPTQGLELVGQAQRLIMHHTAGHVRQLGDPTITTRSEAMQYARDIQGYHMDGNGWNDSGHNFLVCRAGFVLQGRWLTVSAIQAGHMVRSAHCPSQNDQIGIEFEHYGLEEMTTRQREAGARLMAWVSIHYGLKKVMPVEPHRQYFATECPANLVVEIPRLRARAAEILLGV
jgi:hypothetical protein